ncbi:MAG: polysaccharide deacetylase family protein [Anaerolineae bacterium]|nr:polysaccharide deacetylase family protein [Anaerolineae bacterium]
MVQAINAFTVDVEEWYQAELIRQRQLPVEPRAQVEEALEPLLAMLEETGVRATFFVVGEVMRKHPALFRRIHDLGHEIACHGMSHRPLWTMSEAELERELGEFADLYDRVLDGGRPAGFRAPTFSLNQDTRWAIPVLREFGYAYDSSIFPARTPLYGVPDAPLAPYRISAADVQREEPRGPLWEFPMTVCTVAGLRLPVSGGAYLRLWPYWLVRRCLRDVNRTRPFAVYVHPWELYEGTPEVKGLTPLEHAAMYWGRRGGLAKVRALLRDFAFAPMREVLQTWAASVKSNNSHKEAYGA